MHPFRLLLLGLILPLCYTGLAQERQPVVQLSQQIPMRMAFTHANLVIAPGQQISDATLLIEAGRVQAVGKDIAIPVGTPEYDMQGMWIYPGLIDAYAMYNQKAPARQGRGRPPKPQYTSNRDGAYHWNAAMNSHIVLAEMVKTDPKAAESLRSLGFTTANVMPRDGIFRGSGMLIHLGSEALSTELVTAHSCRGLSFRKGSSKQVYPTSLMGSIALIRQTLLDADWYQQAEALYQKNPNQPPYEQNLSLEAWNDGGALPIIFETEDYLNTLRASRIASEFEQDFIYQLSASSYLDAEALKNLDASLILSLNFPSAYDLSDPASSREVDLEKLREWEQAPQNPANLAAAGVPFALTTYGLKKPGELPAMIRKALEAGLSKDKALAALTTIPARMLQQEDHIGSLEAGKLADFIILDGPIFDENSHLYESYIGGKKYVYKAIPDEDPRGSWEWEMNGQKCKLDLNGSLGNIKSNAMLGPDKVAWKSTFTLEGNQWQLQLQQKESHYQLFGIQKGNMVQGFGEDPKGRRFSFQAEKTAPAAAQSADRKGAPAQKALVSSPLYPNGAYGRAAIPAQEKVYITNATVWTNTEEGILTQADVYVEAGKISFVGQGFKPPRDAIQIDGSGKHLTTGVIDEHSHVGISRGVNEGSHAVSAEVRIGDVINPTDVNIYRQLAGGVTTIQQLHGSANPIGGQSAIIKMRWGADAEGLKFDAAPGFIKFALGENVKRSNAGDNYTVRYPQTRMGVEQLMKDAFQSAKDYRVAIETWELSGKNQNIIPPKRDLQLETLLEILDGKRHITCHSYVQSEITMLIRLAEAEGFKINTFTHILEGYKVADKMKEHGATGSTFSDWWAYKYEVVDAIPYNAALMYENGVNVCINSDNREMARRLNQEAAKAVKYGGVPEEEAWKMVTLNPAKALHIDHRVGSIAVGKDADIVLWDDHPMSIYAKPQHTWIDGRRYFDLETDLKMREAMAAERLQLIQKMRQSDEKKGPAFKGKRNRTEYHCEDLQFDFDH